MKDDSIGVARASSAKYLKQCEAYSVQCLTSVYSFAVGTASIYCVRVQLGCSAYSVSVQLHCGYCITNFTSLKLVQRV
jgi:hypothetical protein